MKDLISDIVKALVDQPDQVSVTEVEGGHTVVLELSVAKSDMGKIIGKHGRTGALASFPNSLCCRMTVQLTVHIQKCMCMPVVAEPGYPLA